MTQIVCCSAIMILRFMFGWRLASGRKKAGGNQGEKPDPASLMELYSGSNFKRLA